MGNGKLALPENDPGETGYLFDTDGGAGSRTPVRTSIQDRIYVHRLRFKVSSGRHEAIQPPNKLSKISRRARKRSLAPARIYDTRAPPQASCRHEQVRTKCLRSQSQVRVGNCVFSQLFYQETENLDTQRSFHQIRRIRSPPIGLNLAATTG